MKDADRAIAELAEQGIVLDAATEAAFRAAWEAIPEQIVDLTPAVFVADATEGIAVPGEPLPDAIGVVMVPKRGPGRPRKNP